MSYAHTRLKVCAYALHLGNSDSCHYIWMTAFPGDPPLMTKTYDDWLFSSVVLGQKQKILCDLSQAVARP